MSIKTIMVGAIASTSFVAAALLFPTAVHAQEASSVALPPSAQAPPANVTVQAGDMLVRIAGDYQTTYVRLFDANPQIVDPDMIRPGDIVRIPAVDEVLASRPIPGNTAVQTTSSSTASTRPTQRTAAAASSYQAGVWDRLAQCESSGNWSINTGNGYYGGLQFNLATWQSNGGTGYPHQASKAEQIAVAERLAAARGFSPWPQCAAKLGLL